MIIPLSEKSFLRRNVRAFAFSSAKLVVLLSEIRADAEKLKSADGECICQQAQSAVSP